MTQEPKKETIDVNIDAWWGVFQGRAMVACFPWKEEAAQWIECRGSDYVEFEVLQLWHRRGKEGN